MKRVLFIFCLGFPFIFLNAQIKVATNNNVGIGTSNPQSLLSVNSEGSSLYTATFHNTGINRTVRIGLSYPSNTNYNIALVGAIDNYSSGFKNIAGYFSANSSSTVIGK